MADKMQSHIPKREENATQSQAIRNNKKLQYVAVYKVNSEKINGTFPHHR